jgi:hypothetical protein
MLLGITDPADNAYTWASTQQEVTIPADTASVALRLCLHPISEELDGPLRDAQYVRIYDKTTSCSTRCSGSAGTIRYGHTTNST